MGVLSEWRKAAEKCQGVLKECVQVCGDQQEINRMLQGELDECYAGGEKCIKDLKACKAKDIIKASCGGFIQGLSEWRKAAEKCQGVLKECVQVCGDQQEINRMLQGELDECYAGGEKCIKDLKACKAKDIIKASCGGVKEVRMPEWCNSDMEMECFLKGVEEGVR